MMCKQILKTYGETTILRNSERMALEEDSGLTLKCGFSLWVFYKSAIHIYQDTNQKTFPTFLLEHALKSTIFNPPPQNQIILNSYLLSLNNFKRPSWVARNSCFSILTMTAMVRDTVGVHCHYESRKLHFK